MNIFKGFPMPRLKGNVFNLTHEKKLSFNYGELIPILLQDIVPGDKFSGSTEVFLRFAPMLAPVMHRLNVYVHFFFVPNRLVWPKSGGPPATSGWEPFITGGATGLVSPTFPQYTIVDGTKNSFVAGKLSDYLGIPVTDGLTITQGLTISLLPFRGYQLIYNDYYRDPNLISEIQFSTGSTISGTITNDIGLRNRAWEKDYFTSALPWSQRGGDVNLPIEGIIDFVPDYKDSSNVYKSDQTTSATDGALSSASGTLTDFNTDNAMIKNLEASTEYPLEDISITINDLRTSVQLQKWLETNARGGGRYIEQVFAHFGIISSDARMDRPEYLGGGKAPVVISEVLASAESTNYDVGDMFGHGIAVGNTNKFSKRFEEHGYLFGIMSVMPRTAYQQGVDRHWIKSDKTEFYWPEFARLGEQEVYNQELYHDYEGTDDAQDTFGYQSRYAEYKHARSSVHGDMRDDLLYWHMGRVFTATPSLNQAFVELDHTTAGVHRVHVVTSSSYDKIYGQILNKIKAWRPMPKYGIPAL